MWKIVKFCQIVILVIFGHVARLVSAELIYRTTNFDNVNRISDLDKETPDFIEKYGYIAETHLVTTEDGYILTMFRIPRSKTDLISNNYIKRSLSNPVVVFQHGILGASDNWVLSGPKSFPFMLADAGFDVWLPDSRGNFYSKKHANISVHDSRFWDFSFHEQGYYDLAACIDYALGNTGQEKVFYIGHSRGTTMGYALLSTRPEYNDKIILMASLAPVAYLKHTKGPILQAFIEHATPKELERIIRQSRFYSFPGKTKMSMEIRKGICRASQSTQNMCARMLFLLNGFDNDLLNRTMLPVYYSHFPAGGATKELVHYLQIAKSDRFQQYDYGKEENLNRYGQSKPPLYDLKKITAPISLHYADNDYFVSMKDMIRLAKQLRSLAGSFRVPFDKFNHIDFIWGTKADVLVYKPMIKLLLSYVK